MEQTNPVDGWTAVHLLSGAALAWLGVDRSTAYSLIVGVELGELLLREQSPFFKESAGNIAVDLAAGVGAFELVRAGND